MAEEPFSSRFAPTSTRCPSLEFDIDDGHLYRDSKYGAQYADLMRELKEIVEQRVSASVSGDQNLNAPHLDEEEAKLWGQLMDMYADLRLRPGVTAEGLLNDRRKIIYRAAESLKPRYDAWEIQMMEGPETGEGMGGRA